jgi:hypothetical protein
MLEFVRALRRERALLVRLPGLIVAFLIAEAFYKFHSFTLETLAFLATWLAIDWVCDRLFAARKAPPSDASQPSSIDRS